MAAGQLLRVWIALGAVALVASSVFVATGGSASPKPIKIGSYAPLTGPAASSGQLLVNAEKLAISQINAAGGVKGRPLQLVTEDDQGLASAANTAVSALASDSGVLGVIGTYGSTLALPTSALLEQLKVPNIQPEAAAPTMTTRGLKYLSNLYGNAEDLYKPWFNYLSTGAIKPKSIGIVEFTNPTVQVFVQQAKAWAAAHNVPVVDDELVQANQPSYADAVTKLKAAKPDLVMQYLSGTADAATFTHNMQAQGFSPRWYFVTLGSERAYVKAAGNASVGVIGRAGYLPQFKFANNAQFASGYKKAYGFNPGNVEATGYESVQIFAQALASLNGNYSRDALQKALASGRTYQTVGGAVKFDAQGEANANSVISQDQGPDIVVLYPAASKTKGGKLITYLKK
jgi:branched-chain amino acid transport system substrate-binding protein